MSAVAREPAHGFGLPEVPADRARLVRCSSCGCVTARYERNAETDLSELLDPEVTYLSPTGALREVVRDVGGVIEIPEISWPCKHCYMVDTDLRLDKAPPRLIWTMRRAAALYLNHLLSVHTRGWEICKDGLFNLHRDMLYNHLWYMVGAGWTRDAGKRTLKATTHVRRVSLDLALSHEVPPARDLEAALYLAGLRLR